MDTHKIFATGHKVKKKSVNFINYFMNIKHEDTIIMKKKNKNGALFSIGKQRGLCTRYQGNC